MVSFSGLLQGGLLLADNSVYKDLASPQQASVEQYNVINFLGGAAPYKQSPGHGISTDIPQGCKLEQVQLLSRHGERFPTPNKAKKFEKVLSKIKANKGNLKGSLSFLNTYKYFVKDTSQYGLETSPKNSKSIYAGTLNEIRHGAAFRDKYNDLYNPKETLPVFTSNSNRVHESALSFIKGFMSSSWNSTNYKINTIGEDKSQGANSLTPRDACNYDDESNSKIIKKFSRAYLTRILKRFQDENSHIKLAIDENDIEAMFDMCAFELNVLGESQFCKLFTNEDFIYNGYSGDLSKYYENGPGQNMSAPIGSVLLNASLQLLQKESNNKIWLSFTHDTDIDHYLSALGIFTPKEDLPTDHIEFGRSYIHANLVPQGARLYTEKFKCGDDNSYVRYVLNDAVAPINSCASGPGFSCPLDKFEDFLEKRLAKYDYLEQCEVPSNVSQSLTFYWDYKTTEYNAPLEV